MSDAMRRVSDARTFLAAMIPFLGFLTLRLRPRVATPQDGVPTAGVGPDGTLVVNEEFVATLDDPELRGLICHEVMHPACHVFERRNGREMRGWNVAHDFVINLIIQEFITSGRGMAAKVRLPPGGLLDTKYDGMSAEEVWEALPKMSSPGGGPGGKPGEKGEDFGGIGQDCRPDLSSTKNGQKAGRGDSSAQERLAREWKTAVVAAAQVHEEQKGRGSLPGGLRIMIDEMLNPKRHWLSIINQWLGENAGDLDLTYMRPSRRSQAAGEILIGRRRKNYPDVTVFWDTSGSMFGEEKKIFPEVQQICEELDLTIRVILIDSAIHADLTEVTEAIQVAEAMSGGGGSDFRPAFDLLDEERNTSVVIAFTDGYIGVPETMPECLKGVVWVVTSGGVDPTRGKWGQALRLDPDDNGTWG